MFRRPAIAVFIAITAAAYCLAVDPCAAQPGAPQAPASVSWFPHAEGATMYINNSPFTRMKGVHGLRNGPEYIGSISQPLWGWDVNGYYRGPQKSHPDPADCQLPIGLIYPVNGRALPPPPARKVVAKGARRFQGPRRLHVPVRGQHLTRRQRNTGQIPVQILASKSPSPMYAAPRYPARMYAPPARPTRGYAASPYTGPARGVRQRPRFPAYPRPR